jgi:formylglycine-generating enzyme required for sulfatase activity
MKPLLLPVCLLFAIQASAQTIPKSIDKKVIPKTQKTTPKIVVKQKPVYIEKNKDSDGDGLIDAIDDCPYEKGSPKNNGCPEPKKLTIKLPEMVYIPGGTFLMGSEKGLNGRSPIKMTVSSFNIGKYEISVAEFKSFCNATSRAMPSDSDNPDNPDISAYPVESIIFDDAIAYCKWLSEITGKKYRLPTSAEWEFAARGGLKSNGYLYSGSNDPDAVAWYNKNSAQERKKAGSKKPNELGIYDMSGNMGEWCSDFGGPNNNYEDYRIIRGGTYMDSPVFLEVTVSSNGSPAKRYGNYGFRVVTSE